MKKATVLLMLLWMLVACGGSMASENTATRGEAGAPPAEPAFEEEAAADSGGDAFDGDEGQAVAQAQATRRIIYTGSLQLRVDEPREMAQSLAAIAQRYGGYVSEANIYEVREETYRATVTLRVNADQFDEAMEELRGLADEVLNENIDTQDVTDQYVDLEARIENLERTEEELQILLTEARERGGNTEDILAIYRELTDIRGQIESLQGRLNVLADQVSLATITVDLTPPQAQVQLVDEEWSITRTIRSAFRTLTEGLQALADLGIFFLIAVAPILLLGLLALYLIFRVARWLYRRTKSEVTTTPAPPTPTSE